MTGPDAFRAALAALDLPPEWQVEVAIRPRRRKTGIQVNPGGGVAVLIPPTAAPEQVARFVGSHRRWITEKVDTATRLAPDHAVKEFVDGEEFDLLGRRYRLQLVDASPAAAAQLPLITSDGVLSARTQRPELVRRAVIGLYQQVGLACLRREGRQCAGNPQRPESMPTGTVEQTFTISGGLAYLDTATVQIDHNANMTVHAVLLVNGEPKATNDQTPIGDTIFTFGRVPVRPGNIVTLKLTWSGTAGKLDTIYTTGNPPNSHLRISNTCSDYGSPHNIDTTTTGLRATVGGWRACQSKCVSRGPDRLAGR